ncbi:zinc finger HIT domain-containing protein 3 [Ranitomeya imitator]|uniref:zinc finger HIT domain-containing protein 3 n=1 Tax=Ranitomeya imitator TaxID=111125 RepID=UPI0037E9A7C3
MADPCSVCSVEAAKYRCPHCRLRYCSLDCCRTHKEGCVPKEASRSSVAGVPDPFLTRVNSSDENDETDAVPLQKLTLLGNVCHFLILAPFSVDYFLEKLFLFFLSCSCSLDCCRTHKEGCVPKEASRSSVAGVPDPFLTRVNSSDENDETDAVPLQKLTLLGLSEELSSLLLNVHLKQLLVTLDQTENKDEALKQYMQEPLFVEFADKCLSLVDVEEKENLFSK